MQTNKLNNKKRGKTYFQKHDYPNGSNLKLQMLKGKGKGKGGTKVKSSI